MRTMKMIWGDTNCRHDPCAACGRELKGRLWAVHVIDGGDKVLHPADEPLYVSDAGEMGFHFIGPECRKRFGEYAVRS